MASLSVLIVDPQRMFAEALAAALRGYPGLTVVDHHPRTGANAIRGVDAHRPDVLVSEYWLEEMKAPAATRSILSRVPDTIVIAVSWLPGPHLIGEMLEAGAVGFLTKNEPVAHLVDGIHRARAGERPIFREELEGLIGVINTREAMIEQAGEDFAALRPREMEVLRLIGHGLDARQIAGHLGLTQGTVRNYINNVLVKTGTRSQVEAVSLARDQGIIL